MIKKWLVERRWMGGKGDPDQETENPQGTREQRTSLQETGI